MTGSRKWLLTVLAVAALLTVAAILASCGEWQAGDGDGWVLMVPWVDEEAGMRGLWPAELPEGAHFVAVSLPMTTEELGELAIANSNLYVFPEPAGVYEGDWFQWNLFSYYARLNDLGPEMMRVELGLTSTDEGGEPATRYIGLVALPDVYDAYTSEFEAMFLHALDAAAPLE
jgi:hypothetical protein